MNRTAKIIKPDERKPAVKNPKGDKMGKAEKLSLLSEIERIVNSQHVALQEKIKRLREGIEQAEN